MSTENTKPTNPKDRAATHKLDPTLFQVINAYAGREQVRLYLALVIAAEDLPPTTKRLELARLCTEEARLNEVIKAGIPSLGNDDALRLMQQFEPVAA